MCNFLSFFNWFQYFTRSHFPFSHEYPVYYFFLSHLPFVFTLPVSPPICISTFYLFVFLHPVSPRLCISTSCVPRAEAVAGYQRVLQVDLEVNGLTAPQGGREATWQVEYPLTRTLTSEVRTLLRLAPPDLGSIVPLAMVTNSLDGGGWRSHVYVCVCVIDA